MFLLQFASFAVVASAARLVAALGPAPGSIKNLVTFGDSYTDVVSNEHLYSSVNQTLTDSFRAGLETVAFLGRHTRPKFTGISICSHSQKPERHARTT